MADGGWNNPWKVTTIAIGVVAATSLATGLVVANLTGKSSDKPASETAQAPRAPRTASAQGGPAPAMRAQPAPAPPSPAVIATCNQSAAAQAGQRDKAAETIKDGVIGAVAGAALGAAGGAIAGGGRGAGKGAAIGGLVGAGGGTLYGLKDNKEHDERYREAYASCMRSHGYTG
jgi:hypothetical protein